MFLHLLKYNLKSLLRTKEFLFWLIAFPIILGTLFQIAFSNIFDTEMKMHTIPLEISSSDNCEMLTDVMEKVTTDDGTPLFEVTVVDSMSEDKLKNGDTEAFISEDLRITVSPEGDTMSQTIIKEFVDTYRSNAAVIEDAYINDPANVENVVNTLMSDAATTQVKKLTDDDMNTFNQYFYNLIAMVALYGSLTGLSLAVTNQANLSATAARKCVAPTHKLTNVVAGITAGFIAQSVCVIISISYVHFVLGKNLGSNLPLVYLSGIVGGFAGISIGYFFGSFGKKPEAARNGMLSSFTMLCCFLSGLMVSNMKLVIEEKIPFINRINPAALISDMFYYMNIDSDYGKYTEKLISIIIVSVLFTVLTLITTRRKKYASL